MTDTVLRSAEGRIGILTVNNPPVNALAAGVRNGIKDGVEAMAADPHIDAVVPSHMNSAEMAPFLSVTWPGPRWPMPPASTQAMIKSATPRRSGRRDG